MAKPTAMQSYYLGLLWYGQIFGVVFAVIALGITVANISSLAKSADIIEIGLNLIAGLAFCTIGCALARGAWWIKRRYRAYIDSEID